ncbi:hypothetical protein CORC01_05694 [Colletotrichum orchidophilum]|uniref:Carbohydrate-binding-like protein n=1 Tax=Colletotrichum orchidophilum TaxID=1209926 RepID=A0A1G4BC77_9PEZI|nr:uncharacterized protein CORC01_05694 [Colletotrichum orchidophilum]OHE99004.1 hypothetical protein CORC01_05694 [Colletotrichum orchidophilum]
MRSAPLISAFVALAKAQDLVWQVIDDAPEPPQTTVPIGATPTIVPYDANAAAASVVAEVNASPLPQETAPVKSEKKRLVERAACDPQPSGSGPVPSPDTPAAFLSSADLASAANNAATPSGYFNTFTNLQGSSSAYGYMGYTTLSSYDTQACASNCDAINGCVAFNIYFERDPTVEPADACPNPPSTNVIKCVFWGGPVYENTANNLGQWRNQFEVVIAGSNGYVAQRADPQPGFNSAVYLGDNSINAPLDCAGYDTFLGSKIFTDGPFDPSLCAAACTAQSQYNLAHPPSNAPAQTCQFFNTFFVLKNGVPEGQYCSLYSESWDTSYATNNGQWRGNDHYTISYSFSYTNATDAGKPRIPCAVASASSAIVTSSLQPYCSSLLGYTTPVVTATETDFSTVPATTVITTVTPLTTSYSTTTQLVAVTKQLKRDLPPRPTTTCLHDDPTPLDHSVKVRRGLWARDEPLVNGTKDDDGNFLDVVALPDVAPSTNATSSSRKARRDGTPAGLAGFSGDVISSACSLLATPVTTTITASATTIQTIVTGAASSTTTAATSTVIVVQTVTSTTTINVAASAPTGTIGYLSLNPIVNPNSQWALSDDATHMTDNWYRQGSRETFIVAADGSLYSVTHNAYYYISTSSSYSLLYWSNDNTKAMKIFSYTTLPDGTSQVFMNANGQAYQFCIRPANKVSDGNTGSGQHIYAFTGATSPLSYCTTIDLIIIPA